MIVSCGSGSSMPLRAGLTPHNELGESNLRLSIPNLRSLRAFEAVGRLESVSGAARAIHLSQPAVTQAIAKIESIVGESLFDRRATGTYLTAEGVTLHLDTARLLTSIESALSALLPGRSVTDLHTIINKLTNSQLECLIAITECGNSRIAAKRYDTHESSINRSVRELEKAVGAKLVRRTAAGYPGERGRSEFRRATHSCLSRVLRRHGIHVREPAERGGVHRRAGTGQRGSVVSRGQRVCSPRPECHGSAFQ